MEREICDEIGSFLLKLRVDFKQSQVVDQKYRVDFFLNKSDTILQLTNTMHHHGTDELTPIPFGILKLKESWLRDPENHPFKLVDLSLDTWT
mmetsp:Transcript_14425/g.24614  ORF Transcript_14425/g.24614 Transcript_14425/m.24614 type:complete len:92 (+) Transcript_14425:1969-2244(+)